MEFVIATTNIHKIREFRSLLKPFGFDLLSLKNFPEYTPPEETEDSFRGNAELKASYAAAALGKWALADDSGLIVPSLGGLPGVHSARYAGEGATDRENCLKLLSAMKNVQDTQRYAYFECVISIASPEGDIHSFHGSCEGMILEESRGRNGFSYDSVFQKHEYSKSFAELDEEIKNRISHRRKAFDKASAFLQTIQENALLD
jgi:XTP/dITP diphosphohydrolase